MLITTDPEEAKRIIALYKLRPVVVTNTKTTNVKSVYDVTLLDDNVEIPKSIVTNGIVTHNSSEPNYLEQILKAQGVKIPVEQIFGLRNPQTSRWAVKPRVRMYNESLAEKFFDSMAKLERILPDKVKVGDDWFYVYAHTKENIAALKGKYDKSYYQETGKMRMPAENSLPQALLIIDSYVSMLPEGQDVDDPGSAMAMQARMFSEQIKRVKGKMKPKRITIVGMNQLREKPMVMFGCLHGECSIPFVDGRSFTIKEIVDQKIQGQVWSYNEDTCKLEPKDIIAWHNNGKVENQDDWLTITTDSIETKNGIMSVTVTQDHEILTDRGWIKAKNLTIDDCVISMHSAMPKYVTIRSITEGSTRKFRLKTKYDITVKDNHNYLAGNKDNGFIVSNSPEYEPGGKSLQFFCFASDTLLQTSNGLLYAHEIREDTYLPKVLGESGLEEPTIFKSMGVSTIVKVISEDGFFVEGKPNHRVLAIRDAALIWLALNELTKDDFILIKFGAFIFCDNASEINTVNSVCDLRPADYHTQIKFFALRFAEEATTNFDNVKELNVARLLLLNLGIDTSSDNLSLTIKDESLLQALRDQRNQQELENLIKNASRVDFGAQYSILDFDDSGKSKTAHTIADMVDKSLIAKRVTNVEVLAEQMTYDFNMPVTHTVVTNGIISHNSDCRVKVSSRANPHGKGQIHEEEAYNGVGTDKYRYIHAKAIKNKLSTPYLEGMMRVWIEDGTGQARGFDIVHDTFQYLLMTGQIEGKRNNFRVKFEEWQECRPFKWNDFKTLILGTKAEQIEIFDKFGLKPINVRNRCKKQLADGNGVELFFEQLKRGSKIVAEE